MGQTRSARLGSSAGLRWLLLGAGLFAAGCTPGIAWKFDTFDNVYAESKTNQKLTFVYFRHWFSPACTEFEDKILKDKAVLDATADMNCVPLEYGHKKDQELGERWGLMDVPAFAVVAPDGTVLAQGYKAITLDSLLGALQQAKNRGKPPTQPAASQP